MATTLTIRLKPQVHSCTSATSTGYGLHPSAGTSTEGSGDCSTYLDEGQDALDETNYGYLRSSATAATYTTGRFEHTFGALPSGLTISKVRVVAYLRSSNAGSAIIDESPRMKGFVNPGGTRYYQTSPTYVTVTTACNRNTQAAAGTFGRYICGEWSTNPATSSAWTSTDLAEGVFKAGVEAGGIAEGQSGDGIPPTTGGSAASVDAAVIELEVEATPTDLVIDPIRAILSRLLRLRRRPLRPVRLEVPAPLAHAAPGDIVYAAEPFWPTPGAVGLSSLNWDRRPLFVLSSGERVGAHVASVVAWDLREHMCGFWSPFYTDLGADDQWTGIAYVDQGGGKTVVRAQSGWIWRPGDGLWRDAASGKWRITPWGLLVCGGSYSGYTPDTGELTWALLNSTLSQGTGGEATSLSNGDTTGFTSWTVGLLGTGTAVVKQDSSFLFDVSGYRRAVRFTNGSPYASNTANITQSVSGYATTQRVRVGIKFKMITGSPANMRFLLRRTTAPTDWDEATNAWVAATSRNTLSSGAAGRASLRQVGDHHEYWSTDVLVGGTGSQTLTLEVGSVAEDSAVVDVFGAALVSTGAALVKDVLRREWIATQGSAIVQAADVIDLDNSASMRISTPERGTITAMVTPLWDHEDLSDGSRKYVLTSMFNTVSNYSDRLYYERTNSTTGKWVYLRVVSAGSGTAEWATSSTAGTLPRYWTPISLSIRWTSSSGELGMTARSMTIHVSGVAGTAAVSPGDSTSAQYLALGRLANGALGSSDDPRLYLDGMIAHLEVLPFCLSDTEIARRHAQLSLPTRPVAV